MEFSADERLVLGAICGYFHTHSTWPTYDYLDKTLGDDHEDLDLEAVAHKLEPFMYDGPYSPMVGWDPQRQTFLSISALSTCLIEGICPQVAEDLEAFMTVLRLCVEKYRARVHDNPQSAQITSEELHDRFGMSELMLRKVFELAARGGLTFGSSSRDASPGQPASWTFNVSPDVRKYRRVATIDDFIRVREHAREEQRRRYQSFTQGTVTTQALIPDSADISESPVANGGSSVPAVVQPRPISVFPIGPFARNEQLCFILMPFAEELVPVYEEAIAPAATQAGLECQRADEIIKPGAVMAQVWRSLMESRVVVADLTNMNPNVFYELSR